MRVATIQMRPVFKDRKANLKQLTVLITRAAETGAKLIVAPELSTTGYSFMSRADAEPFAEVLQYPSDDPDSSFRVMRAIARHYDTHIAWGVLEKSQATGNLFNSQVLMCPDGTYESYSKGNPFANDHLWSTPGRANPPVKRLVIDGKVRKVGLLICRDVRDKSSKIDSFYEPGDSEIVCLSANWGDGAFPANAWMDFARSNKVTLVVSNRYGQEVNNNFGEGGVCIIHPDGTVQCEGLLWNEDCVVYGEV